jgi:hypothetical protein
MEKNEYKVFRVTVDLQVLFLRFRNCFVTDQQDLGNFVALDCQE